MYIGDRIQAISILFYLPFYSSLSILSITYYFISNILKEKKKKSLDWWFSFWLFLSHITINCDWGLNNWRVTFILVVKSELKLFEQRKWWKKMRWWWWEKKGNNRLSSFIRSTIFLYSFSSILSLFSLTFSLIITIIISLNQNWHFEYKFVAFIIIIPSPSESNLN